jgi:Flp pilus assembly pilin Flp
MGEQWGAISTEYALMAGLLAVATAMALLALGDAMDGMPPDVARMRTQTQSVPGALPF